MSWTFTFHYTLFYQNVYEKICMLAALTKMSFKRYMTIIILTKPFTLVVYTYGLTYIIDYFWQMFG